MNTQRNPITVWLTQETINRLRDISTSLINNGGKPREVSMGKIVEVLIQREDTHVYAEKTLLKE
jgi:hypothetical protein